MFKFALEAQTELDVIKAKEVKSAKDTAKEKSKIKSKACLGAEVSGS